MGEYKKEITLEGPATSTRELSESIVKAAQSGRGANKIPSNLSQLRLANMKLHGREDDMELLKAKLLELKKGKCEKNNKSDNSLPELVLISGVSGTGKSALVMSGVKDPAQKMGMTFVGGKFDLNNTSLPLSAFVDAMASLTKTIVEGGERKKVQDDIHDSFEEEDMIILVRALPGCEKLFPLHKECASPRRTSLTRREAISRLQYAIKMLLKIICTHLKGVVLFIDDLQWSDTATLGLLQSISLDSDIPSLLLVGAYREDEVPDTHSLALQIREKEQMGIKITAIKIGNLSFDNVTSLVAEALRMEDYEEAVTPLATTVHRKTEGNAFFVLMFLRSLCDEELLQYNFGLMKWRWDDDAVKAKLATENVATILLNKLSRLHWATQNVLKVASCLGAKFSLSAVAAVTGNLSQVEMRRLSSTAFTVETEPDSDGDTISALDSSTKELEDEGLWEKESEDVRHFGHDKIQLAAFELIPPDKRDSFRGRIGNILLEKLDPDLIEANLFAIVSLRNCAAATICDDKERKELANMSLRAGMKASENAAFDSAAVYFKAGRKVLGSNGWAIDQSLILKLCSEGANACSICGDLDTMNALIAEVLSQAIPIQDKFNAYKVKVMAAHAAGEFNEALNTAFDFRRQIGLPTLKNKPVNTLIIIKEFIKTNRSLGNRTAEDIGSLPDLTDDRIVMGQRMLELSASSSFAVQPTVLPLIIFLLVRASLRYGINASSCDAFAGFGFLLCAFGKLQEGKKMSQAVDLILAKPGMNRMKSRSIFVCEGMIYHWTAPVQATLGPLLEGYQVGLRTGDVESAVNNLANRVIHLYYAGRPLEALQQEIQANIEAMTQLKQDQTKLVPLTILLLVKSFLGGNLRNEIDLKGVEKLAVESGNQNLRGQAITARLELNVFFQEWDDAANLLAEAGDLRSVLAGLITMPRFTVLEALISIQKAKAATTPWLKKRKWKKKALKSIKLIGGWVKKGNVNLVHSLHLIVAEIAALEGKNEKAESNYISAITVASRNGFLQDRALSHELASAYFAGKRDEYWKDYHIECCQKCYSEWGATAKLEQLTNEG